MSQFPKQGDIFLKKYEILSLIGEGAFGRVYRAKDTKLERDAALKIIDATHSSMERFINEVEGIKKLEHPNIVKLYDYEVLPDGSPCLVMEFVNGRELGDILSREGPFSLLRIAEISLQILDALVETHAYGIVHCDLKPENILISKVGAREDFVKLLDFGVASILSSQGQLESSKRPLMGTPQYMAPEQIRRDNLGPWTDIYSLGLIMIELATGKFTVDDPDIKVILQKQLYEPIQLPIELARTDLGLIISNAVEKEASKRYQSAREMFDDIQHALVESGRSPQWGKLDDNSSSSRVAHIGAKRIEDIGDGDSNDFFASSGAAPAFGGAEVRASALDALYFDELSASSSAAQAQERDSAPSFRALLDDALAMPDAKSARQSVARRNSEKEIASAYLSTQETAPVSSSTIKQGLESDFVADAFAVNVAVSDVRSKEASSFRVDGLKPEIRELKLRNEQQLRASRVSRSIVILLVMAVLLVAASLLLYIMVFKPESEQKQIKLDEIQQPVAYKASFNIRNVSSAILTGANCAAIEGCCVETGFKRYKIIATPLNVSVRVAGRTLCQSTPCNIHIFGDVEGVDAELSDAKSKSSFSLTVHENPEGETIFPVLER
ncbi:MAG: serine/threonine-protein kinase [Bradymonadales bacterium]|jgi:serine/threonine protein kinase